jgi:hypothetical protein
MAAIRKRLRRNGSPKEDKQTETTTNTTDTIRS